MSTPRPAFFTVCDRSYFLGAAALVDSLRATGNPHEIVVLDAGLSDRQRRLLSQECRVVPLPPDFTAANPTYYKLLAPIAYADDDGIDVVVVIDSDMIVTHRLDEIVDAAAAGCIVAYPDPDCGRRFPEWEEIFGLPAPPRRQPYVNAGLVAWSRTHHPTLLQAWLDACLAISDHPTVAEGAVGPTAKADQDALNALLMSAWPREALCLRPADEAPQGYQLPLGIVRPVVAVEDADRLACRFRGTPSYVLHSSGHPKPWRTWQAGASTAYTELLVRLLADSRQGLAVPRCAVPWWLRPGLPGAAFRGSAHVVSETAALARRSPAGIRRRLRRRLRRGPRAVPHHGGP